MLRDKRMTLTKDVLKRVIPIFLRMGFRVIVNAWASTNENKGRIKTREVVLDEHLLQVLHGNTTSEEGSRDAHIHTYLEEKVFDILEPKGRTDLYGSCFQLMRQCRTLLAPAAGGTASAGPVYAFVLTDGEHNKLDVPLHQPTHLGEDYFGVYAASNTVAKNNFKFVRTGLEPTVPLCEQFLRKEMDALNGKMSDHGDDMIHTSAPAQTARLTITLVGIGELLYSYFIDNNIK